MLAGAFAPPLLRRSMSSSICIKAALVSLVGLPFRADAFAPTAAGQEMEGEHAVGIRVVRPDVGRASSLSLPILMDGKGATPKASFQADAASGAVRVISGADLAGDKAV